jgi:predicted phosphodiesterase
MKIRVLSDLHLEFRDWDPPAAAADVVVLAGDIHVGVDGLVWGRKHFPDAHILYVPGNHEFYGYEMQSALHELRRVAQRLDVRLLDTDVVVIGGVRFLGATLWTDFALYGSEPAVIARAMEQSTRAMVDYRVIRMLTSGLLTPDDTLAIHQRQVAWLANKLAQPCDSRTVVVTHHLPHPHSVHPRYTGDSLNPSFASDLSALVREPVKLWIHGHTHESMDYVVNGTRVVCNPRGYLPHEPNQKFQPRFVVDLGGPG